MKERSGFTKGEWFQRSGSGPNRIRGMVLRKVGVISKTWES